MKNKIKECLIPALVLMIIGVVVTAALAGVNELTKDTIAAHTREAEDAARREVISADSFEEHTLTAETGPVTYYTALRDGETVGYLFTVTTSGKSSGLTVLTGLNADGTIAGVKITENSETAGYVDKVIRDGLLERIVASQTTADVDVTSNATKTSKGVMKGVKQALAYYAQIKKEVTP